MISIRAEMIHQQTSSVIFQEKLSNISSFQFLCREDLLLFFISCENKVNIFSFFNCCSDETRRVMTLH